MDEQGKETQKKAKLESNGIIIISVSQILLHILLRVINKCVVRECRCTCMYICVPMSRRRLSLRHDGDVFKLYL